MEATMEATMDETIVNEADDFLTTTANLLAGNAIFTAVGPNEERYTFHFYSAKSGKEKGIMIVKLMTGPNNMKDYRRLGYVEDGQLILDAGIGTRETVPTSAALARWLVKLATESAPVPNGVRIVHAGRCLCCSRRLTVPFPENPYRPMGLGPICGGKE